ncbi:MAG: hypothetical protein K2X08_06210, partial [Chlamydiales bacterium]|nr:hypothetical protein [Chlamydiales bacterium]
MTSNPSITPISTTINQTSPFLLSSNEEDPADQVSEVALAQIYALVSQNNAIFEAKNKTIREARKAAEEDHKAELEAHEASQKANKELKMKIEALEAKVNQWKSDSQQRNQPNSLTLLISYFA